MLVEDANRGWRRVVASPKPIRIVEMGVIRRLVESGTTVVTAGGGGIPVIAGPDGSLTGAAAVIDKDLVSALLATALGAEMLVISTAVEKVALDFGTAAERPVDHMTADEARRYLADGRHFAGGSMAPKIQAVLDYLDRGGTEAIVTDPDNVELALAGKTGTHFTNEKGARP